ncbi:hypothetical protein G6F31_016920 [Rhizopus arrhizus]|nr:hypothetical protein G6F31_016920 [Rhizopus arrhizus]
MATVVQADAGAGYHHARAEAVIVGLDEGHHGAVGIRGGQVDRAAGGGRTGGGHAGAVHRDQARALGQIGAVKECAGIGTHVARVCHMVVQVRECQLHRFDADVVVVGAVAAHAFQIELFKHAECHQRGNALAVGRDLMQLDVAERLRDGGDPFGAVLGQIGGA